MKSLSFTQYIIGKDMESHKFFFCYFWICALLLFIPFIFFFSSIVFFTHKNVDPYPT